MTRTIAILALAGATACGGRATAPSTTAAAQSAATTYQSTGQDLATTVARYQAATATMPDVDACHAAEADYESHMNDLVDRMRSQSGMMDDYMAGAMGGAAADMDCVAAAMSAEYARHRAAACTAADVTLDQAEAAHHAATMAAWIDHQRVRYEQMGSAMGITPGTADTTWACVHHADGTFTMDGHPWAPPQVPATPTPTPTPTATPTPTPTPTPTTTPWPRPCGGWDCPCDGSGSGTGGGAGSPHGPMM